MPLPRGGLKTSRDLVQQELRLENVLVCHNDLADADWEMVQPPKSAARLAFIRNLAASGASALRRNRAVSEAAPAGKI
ncbi:MAG: hypothetical protein HZA90_27265 [Verrucomicrobia bacterium]|nr:hypothetical protein [Verrucomicrobiota bacterium]